jgi:nucleotide-binding universal stress UspA family protein
MHHEVWKMFEKVLVAIDDSESSQTIFEQAIAFAQVNHSKLMLLHTVVPTDEIYPGNPYIGTPPSAVQAYLDRWHQREAEGLEKLKSMASAANALGISTEFTQSMGDPGTSICALATTWNADLILIGRRGLKGFNEFLMGSVSNYVLHHAPCHVLTIQHGVPKRVYPETLAATAKSI